MAVYRFEHMHVRSIGLERKNNYLILITRVAKSPEQFEPASGRSEKQIVSECISIISCPLFLTDRNKVYDMDKQEAI